MFYFIYIGRLIRLTFFKWGVPDFNLRLITDSAVMCFGHQEDSHYSRRVGVQGHREHIISLAFLVEYFPRLAWLKELKLRENIGCLASLGISKFSQVRYQVSAKFLINLATSRYFGCYRDRDSRLPIWRVTREQICIAFKWIGYGLVIYSAIGYNYIVIIARVIMAILSSTSFQA